MTDKAKETISKYGLWIAGAMMLIALGGQVSTCSGGLLGAGRAIEKKASAARVRTLEVQVGKIQECVGGIKSRLGRMDRKIDRLLERKAAKK